MKNLSPKEEERLEKALLSAFPSCGELERMLQHKMSVNLNEIVREDLDLTTTAHKLVRWAISQGRIVELIKSARKQNPGNPELKAFYQDFVGPTLPGWLTTQRIFYSVLSIALIFLILSMSGVFTPRPTPQPMTATPTPSATNNSTPTSLPTHTPTPQPSATQTTTPTDTPTPLPSSTATETPTPTITTPPPDMITDPQDGMILIRIPAGEFQMGSNPQKDRDTRQDEIPLHPVTLDEYWMDQTEVTNAMYQKCVAAGVCIEPKHASAQQPDYYTNPVFANYPVINVTWYQAAT